MTESLVKIWSMILMGWNEILDPAPFGGFVQDVIHEIYGSFHEKVKIVIISAKVNIVIIFA